jgi:hypothetical protein
MTRVCGAVLATGLLLVPTPAGAQSERYATVSLSSTQIYESNLFAAPSPREPQGDVSFQLGPAFEVGRLSPTLKLVARYGLAAERYVDQVTLNKALARQDAAIELHHRTSRRIALDARTSYVDTRTPRELNLESGIVVGRARAKRFESSSAMTYDWSRSARIHLDYTFTTDALVGGEMSRFHNAGFALETNSAARRNTQRIDYRIRQFGFSDQHSEIWHVVTVGWSRALTRMTTFDAALGPRLSNGTIRPEIAASLNHRGHRGDLSASFSRTQATAIGEGGSFEMQRLAAGFAHHIRRHMTLTARPAFTLGSGQLGRVSVYALELEAAAHPKRGLSVVASSGLGWQKGTLGGLRQDIPYRSLSLGLVVTVPRPSTPGSSRVEHSR